MWMQILKGNKNCFRCWLCLTLVFFFPVSITLPMAEPIRCPDGKGTSLLERYNNIVLGTHFFVSDRSVDHRKTCS